MKSGEYFTPRSLGASEYVLSLFEPSDDIAILTRERKSGQVLQRITKAATVAEPEFQSWLESRNLAGSDIFVGMNPIKEGAYSRTKENIKEIRHVYLDLDRNGNEALQSIRHSQEVPPPNFVLNTSPEKFQVIWKIRGLDIAESEALLHNMAYRLGGDSAATDVTRVLRLPGFANRKMTEEFVVQARQESDKIYSLRDFTIPEASPEAPRHVRGDGEPSKVIRSGFKSQSELDWAYAKRALARGVDPEVVIQSIADYRAQDKSDPEYYARYTVTKAAAALRTDSSKIARSSISTNESGHEPEH